MTERPLDLRPLIDDLARLSDLTVLAAAGPRELFDHERRAGIQFHRATASIDAIARQTYGRQLLDRGRFLSLVADYARSVLARHPSARGVDARALLLALAGTEHALVLLPGASELIGAARRFHLAALRDAAALGAVHIRSEARTQGLQLPATPIALAGPDDPEYSPVAGAGGPPSDDDLNAELVARAQAAADGPLVDTAIVLRNYALGLPATSWSYGSFIDHVLAAGAASSTRGLETDASRVPAQQAWGLGRQAEAAAIARAVEAPAEIYASELMDGNTCPPCGRIDGNQYETLDEAFADYPGGTYALCRGGARCRGTLVMVWSDEASPTVE